MWSGVTEKIWEAPVSGAENRWQILKASQKRMQRFYGREISDPGYKRKSRSAASEIRYSSFLRLT